MYDCHANTETFTMSALDIGQYTLHLRPYSSGGRYDLRVICDAAEQRYAARGGVAAEEKETDTESSSEWATRMQFELDAKENACDVILSGFGEESKNGKYAEESRDQDSFPFWYKAGAGSAYAVFASVGVDAFVMLDLNDISSDAQCKCDLDSASNELTACTAGHWSCVDDGGVWTVDSSATVTAACSNQMTWHKDELLMVLLLSNLALLAYVACWRGRGHKYATIYLSDTQTGADEETSENEEAQVKEQLV